MKHLKIKNLGPLDEVDIELKQVNVIIGPQSSGKSCVLKVACYCTWVEKRIEMTQNAGLFDKEDAFLSELVRFHKLQGYVKPDTFIAYESDYLCFAYNHASKKFRFVWKDLRWDYHRSKVTYIPAERNMVAVIPNWFEVKLVDDNIRDFMSDWETARKATPDWLDVLNLGVSYHYDPVSQADWVALGNGNELRFTNTSSGLQSLIPLFVHLNYWDKLRHKQEESGSVKRDNEQMTLAQAIYRALFQEDVLKKNENKATPDDLCLEFIGKMAFVFADEQSARRCKAIYESYVNNNFCDIFLEEPEANLFPPTQVQLIDWLLGMTKGEHPSRLFVATHSPYILTAFLERRELTLGLFFTHVDKGGHSVVKTASDADVQEIYDNGVDAFFNIETFV